MSRLFRSLFFACVLLSVFVLPVFAQPAAPADPTDLASVIQYLLLGGAAIVVGAILSWGSEHVPGFAALDPAVKWVINVGGSIALGVLALWLSGQPALIAQLQPYFQVIVLCGGVALANQAFHFSINRAK